MKPAIGTHSSMRRIVTNVVLAAASVAFGGGAMAADPSAAGAIPAVANADKITLKYAWMRPAAAGMTEAQAYVDIVSERDGDLELVGAATPFAKKVELVEVTRQGDQTQAKVVASMPVPGGKTTRLPYRGNHLRLVEITKDFGNGTAVPLTLTFKSPDGKELTATIIGEPRGLLLPQQVPASTPKDPEPATKDAAPAGTRPP